MSKLKNLVFKLRVIALKPWLLRVPAGTPEIAALRVEGGRNSYSCIALEDTIFATHLCADRRERGDIAHHTRSAYKMFTCMFGRPWWWNSCGYDAVRERAGALREFGRAVRAAHGVKP